MVIAFAAGYSEATPKVDSHGQTPPAFDKGNRDKAASPIFQAYSNLAPDATWPLTFDGEQAELAPQGSLLVSDGETMRKMAMEGVGLARLTRFLVDEDIRQGRLVPVMEEHNPGDREEVHAVFLGQGRLMPGRVRVFLDFLYDNIRISPSD